MRRMVEGGSVGPQVGLFGSGTWAAPSLTVDGGSVARKAAVSFVLPGWSLVRLVGAQASFRVEGGSTDWEWMGVGLAWAPVMVRGVTAATPRPERSRVRAVPVVMRPASAPASAPAMPGSCSRAVARTARTSHAYAIQATALTASTVSESRSYVRTPVIDPAVIQRSRTATAARASTAMVPFSSRIIVFIPLDP